MPDTNPADLKLTPPALPKGGGATRGIGEKFAVQGFTGRGSLSVPLPLTPGRSGFQPDLSLSYDTGTGNGPFGLGWRVNVASIFRKTDFGIPRYLDDGDKADVFLLSGEDLVPFLDAAGSPRDKQYRTRIEGGYSRIERLAEGWQVISRDNRTHVFGRSPTHRIVDPDNDKHIFEWLLEETTDDCGNVIAYEYKAEDTTGVAAADWEKARLDGTAKLTNRYLKAVGYGNKTSGGRDFAFHLVFDFGEHDMKRPTVAEQAPWTRRADPFSSYRSGFEIRTWRLCRRVLMFHDFAELGDQPTLVRSLDLGYLDDPSLTRLSSVLAAGYARKGDAYDVEVMPPTAFEYNDIGQPGPVQTMDLGAAGPPLVPGVPAPGLWSDVLGEGIPGLLIPSEPSWQFKPNKGGGKLGAAIPVDRPPSLGGVDGLDGDGPKKLMKIKDLPVAGLGKRTPTDDRWAPFVAFTDEPPADSPDPNPVTDPDSRGDVFVAAGDSVRWARKSGGAHFDEVRAAGSFRDEDSGTELVFTDDTEAIFLADMTGDGLSDLVRVRAGEVAYWPNVGGGRFAVKVVMGQAPSVAGFKPERVRFADIDRSGTADLIYLEDDRVRVFRNLAGNAFAAEQEVGPLPQFSVESAQIVDVLGNGTCCLVWAADAKDASSPVRFLALSGEDKPHLLRRVFDNVGLETRIHHRSSTAFFLEDKAANKPWVTTLGFPVQVVDRMEIEDLVSQTVHVTTFRYRHGYYDDQDRELRGFSFSESSDAATDPKQPAITTKTWFHTGEYEEGRVVSRYLATEYMPSDPHPEDTDFGDGVAGGERADACRALKGQALRTEVFAADGSPHATIPFETVEHSYRLVKVQPQKGKSPAVFRCDLMETVDIDWERDPNDPRIQHTLVVEVDELGTALQTVHASYGRNVARFPEQARSFFSLDVEQVANDVSASDHRRVGLPIESREYELTGIAPTARLWLRGEIKSAVGFSKNREIPFEQAPSSGAERRLLSASRTFYAADDGAGELAFGDAGRRALVRRTLHAAFTPSLLQTVYGRRVGDDLLAESQHQLIQGLWWCPSGTSKYDPARFFLPVETTDAYGNVASARYDRYALATVGSKDARRNETSAEIDYRVLHASLVTDANGNRSAARFDLLGAVVATAVMGKAGDQDGDTLDDPTTQVLYDRFGFMRDKRSPCSVRTQAREQHGAGNTRFLTSFEYTDGSGRAIQTKTADDSGWIADGIIVHDNKDNPIETYEPFVSATSDFEDRREGQSVRQRFDAIGRLVRTDFPDGTFESTAFDGWSATESDRNDNVRASDWFKARQGLPQTDPERRAADQAAAHDGTPGIEHHDAMGRTFLAIADGGAAGRLESRVDLDILGHPRSTTDALGRVTRRADHDMLGRLLHERTLDEGEHWILPGADGQPVAAIDDQDRVIRYAYDSLRRPTDVRFIDGPFGQPEVVLRTVYGEDQTDDKKHNLRGRVFQTFDGAGMSTTLEYDFKGNPLRSTAQLARDYKRRVDWGLHVDLDDERFTSSAAYDALNRATSTVLPDRTTVTRAYNAAGLLARQSGELAKRGSADPASVRAIEQVDYNARGQRQLVAFGNGVAARFSYDAASFRLVRQELDQLQDLKYTHDPVGNVTHVEDAAVQTIYFANRQIDAAADYTYDALYRLAQATGREHLGQAGPEPTSDTDQPRVNLLHPGDGAAMGEYVEKYAYDRVGNLTRLAHVGNNPSHPGWTRTYSYDDKNNRLSSTAIGSVKERYTHDAHGNMTSMPHLPALKWDHFDRLQATTRQASTTTAAETTYYTYSASGDRIRKVTEGANGRRREERIYLGDVELYRRYAADGTTVDLERETVEIGPVLVETRTKGSDPSPLRLSRFQVQNQIGSATLELDQQADIISYEEYYPYGGTSYQAVRAQMQTPKRYRYAGKERDEESGLYHFGARYYASWLGRWTACDPVSGSDSPYSFCDGNPITMGDSDGMAPKNLIDKFVSTNRKAVKKIEIFAQDLNDPSKVGKARIRAGKPFFANAGETGQYSSHGATRYNPITGERLLENEHMYPGASASAHNPNYKYRTAPTMQVDRDYALNKTHRPGGDNDISRAAKGGEAPHVTDARVRRNNNQVWGDSFAQRGRYQTPSTFQGQRNATEAGINHARTGRPKPPKPSTPHGPATPPRATPHVHTPHAPHAPHAPKVPKAPKPPRVRAPRVRAPRIGGGRGGGLGGFGGWAANLALTVALSGEPEPSPHKFPADYAFCDSRCAGIASAMAPGTVGTVFDFVYSLIAPGAEEEANRRGDQISAAREDQGVADGFLPPPAAGARPMGYDNPPPPPPR